MCGRYKITKPLTKTVNLVKTNIKVKNTDNYNAHPTQQLPIIKSYTNGKALELCEWGLVPGWSKKLDKFSPLINARKETLMEKVTFKNLIQTSRCVVPADGYYEWKREDKNNQFCIITREATQKISSIHHREPLIINQSQINNYLNVKKDAMKILNSIKPPSIKFHEISKDVNNPINNDHALIKPLN